MKTPIQIIRTSIGLYTVFIPDPLIPSLAGDTLTITPKQVLEMREWAGDCAWLDADDLEMYSDESIIRGVHRHYDGGLTSFLATCK
jgi:hypothetical protein